YRLFNINSINESQVYLPETFTNELGHNQFNQHFIHFGWFLTSCLNAQSGYLNATASISRSNIYPRDGHKHYAIHNDQKFSYVYDSERLGSERNPTIKRGILLSIHQPDSSILFDFLVCIKNAYIDHFSQTEWTQKIHYPKDFLDLGPSWDQGKLTHNMKTWDSIVLKSSTKALLIEDINNFMASEHWYQRMGVSWARGLLLYGPPGCGKTSIIKALSFVHELHLYYLPLDEISSDSDLRALFETIPPRSVVVLEDIDAMGPLVESRENLPSKSSANEIVFSQPRNSDHEVDKKPRVSLSTLLNLIDGLNGVHGRIIIMTTNHPERLDSALLRAGRCDLKIHVDACDDEGIKQLYKLYFNSDIPDEDMSKLAGYRLTPADITSIFLTNRTSPKAAIDQLC
ncbi:MAG: ATP-binding protein, partial [Sphingobacteriaceae bacterium]